MEDVVEDHPADGGLDDHAGGELLLPLALELLVRRQAELDHRVDADLLLAEREEDLVGRGVDAGLDAVLVLVLAGLAGAAGP